jgi:hypothetical protein
MKCNYRRWAGNERETCGRVSAGSQTHAELSKLRRLKHRPE